MCQSRLSTANPDAATDLRTTKFGIDLHELLTQPTTSSTLGGHGFSLLVHCIRSDCFHSSKTLEITSLYDLNIMMFPACRYDVTTHLDLLADALHLDVLRFIRSHRVKHKISFPPQEFRSAGNIRSIHFRKSSLFILACS